MQQKLKDLFASIEESQTERKSVVETVSRAIRAHTATQVCVRRGAVATPPS